MGILNFSKIFPAREVKYKDLKGLTAIIDGSIIAYQAKLGMKNINALTDSAGNPTIHNSVVFAKCLNFQKCGIKQVWVFDYHEKGYVNPAKTLELEKRKKVKEASQAKLKALKDKQKELKSKVEKEKDELFSSDDEDESDEEMNKEKDLEAQIHAQEKIGFSIDDNIINDIKFILDCFCIPWCDTPKGYEAESICAFLTNHDVGDLVWTTDTDAMIYGAKRIVRELKVNKKKQLMMYELDTILGGNDITIDDLRKIAVIAGCDHCKKTPGIGPKTILKKFKDMELTDEQKKAVKVFAKTYDIIKLKWHNIDGEPFEDKGKITKLLDWLESKNFNRERISKQMDKALN